jgi:energy-coupling factor transport system substrate-specific component
MSRHIFENAVNVDDVVELVRLNLGITPKTIESDETKEDDTVENSDENKKVIIDTTSEAEIKPEKKKRKPGSQLMIEAIMAVLAVVTVYVGFFVMEDRPYMAVSILLILYAMVPFFSSFEKRKPKAREIVILAVLIAVGTVGRAAFFMLPNFKPVLAIVIIAGVALGRESGFLVGALTAFVSNFLMGQGPWTPWQMIAMAIVGYLAGLIFHRFSDRINKWVLAIFGAIAAFVIYGIIVDFWTIISMTPDPTWQTLMMVYSAAAYFNVIHAAATVIFILLLAKPMIEKLERVKIKYGMGVFEA